MGNDYTRVDLKALKAIVAQLRTVNSQLAQVVIAEPTATPDSRATNTAHTVYKTARTEFASALATAQPVLLKEAEVLEKWITETEARDAETAAKARKLAGEIKDIPTPTAKTLAGGAVLSDGTVQT